MWINHGNQAKRREVRGKEGVRQGEIDFSKPAENHECLFDGIKLQKEERLVPYRELMKKIGLIIQPVVCPDCLRKRNPEKEIIFLQQSGYHWRYCGCSNVTHWQTDFEGRWIDV